MGNEDVNGLLLHQSFVRGRYLTLDWRNVEAGSIGSRPT